MLSEWIDQVFGGDLPFWANVSQIVALAGIFLAVWALRIAYVQLRQASRATYGQLILMIDDAFYNFDNVRTEINQAVDQNRELRNVTDAELNRYVAVLERVGIMLDRKLIDVGIVNELYGPRLEQLLKCQLPTNLLLRPRVNPDKWRGFVKLHAALSKKRNLGTLSCERRRTQMTEESKMPQPHPLIAIVEKSGDATVEFRGFVGGEAENVVRLYVDLDAFACIEIPKDAVLHWEKDKSNIGRVRVFVSASSSITEVRKQRRSAGSSSLAWRERPGPLDARDFYTCSRECENRFAASATQVLEIESRANTEQDPGRATLLRSQADELKAEAKRALWTCLSFCPSPPIWRFATDSSGAVKVESFSLGAHYSGMISKYLPVE